MIHCSHIRTGSAAVAALLTALIVGATSTQAEGQAPASDENKTTAAVADTSIPPEEETAAIPEEKSASDESASPGKESRGARKRVGVLEMKGSGIRSYYGSPTVDLGNAVRMTAPPNFTDGLTEILITGLIDQGRFQVLERAKINEVLAEQDLAGAGRVDKATAAATGKVTGAQILITGDVTEFSYESKAIGGGLGLFKKKARIGGGAGKITAQMALDLRMIDATTGEVLASSRGEGKASTTGLAADFAQSDKELGVGGAKQTPLGKAARQAVERALEDLAKNTADVQ